MKISFWKASREVVIVAIVAFIITVYQQGADLIDVLQTSKDPIGDATNWANSFGLAALLTATRAAIAAGVAKLMQVLPIG